MTLSLANVVVFLGLDLVWTRKARFSLRWLLFTHRLWYLVPHELILDLCHLNLTLRVVSASGKRPPYQTVALSSILLRRHSCPQHHVPRNSPLLLAGGLFHSLRGLLAVNDSVLCGLDVRHEVFSKIIILKSL